MSFNLTWNTSTVSGADTLIAHLDSVIVLGPGERGGQDAPLDSHGRPPAAGGAAPLPHGHGDGPGGPEGNSGGLTGEHRPQTVHDDRSNLSRLSITILVHMNILSANHHVSVTLISLTGPGLTLAL